MEDPAEVRRRVKRIFELRNINLKPDAVTCLADHLKDKTLDEMKEYSRKLVDIFIEKKIDDRPIDVELLKNCLKKDSGKKNNFEVINSVDWKLESSNLKKIEFMDALRMRFMNVKTRIESISLTSIELLYSRTNVSVSILGMLFKEKSDRYFIEDDTGSLRLRMGKAVFEEGIFFEGGIYEFQGMYNNGILNVQEIRLPKLRPETSKIKNSGNWSGSDSVVILSDVWLDDPSVLKMIYKILDGFSHSSPYSFIFCGSFLSPENETKALNIAKKGFEHISNIFREFSESYRQTQFVFVPSASDFPDSTVLPRDELPFKDMYFSDMPNVHFASNPSKFLCRDQTIVVLRDDVIEDICRNAIKAPVDGTKVAKVFCETILSQRHFSPLPVHLAPKILHKDHCFSLCPLPDVLILADQFETFFFQDSGCTILNPGSFARSSFEFLVYYPASRKVEQSSCT
ncbi:hypothetical protein FO519_007796 [Halicephalobus sp. NKZ332]|nr:hypothetical protein FO519_007796 [Halicephalobus sp. NKZ332]